MTAVPDHKALVYTPPVLDIEAAVNARAGLGHKIETFLDLEIRSGNLSSTYIHPRDAYKATDPATTEEESLLQWQRGARCLKEMQLLQDDGGKRWEEFEKSLSRSQKHSWIMITNWLQAKYMPKHLADAAQSAIFNAGPVKSSHETGSAFFGGLQFPPDALCSQSEYHANMASLYTWEFVRVIIIVELPNITPFQVSSFLHGLDEQRKRAFGHETCQSFANTLYNFPADQKLDGGLSKAMDTSMLKQNLIEKKKSLRDGSDRELHYSSPIMDSYYQTTKTSIGDEHPAYLWDVEAECTVEVPQGSSPQYVCVSHTWGRWRTKTKMKLAGVPWEVPTNTLFEINSLPAQMKRLGMRLNLPFVWFDLVCIPQTKEGDLGKVAEREINRQALIFQNSTACVAWLNYIDDWEAETSFLTWAGLYYLKKTTSSGLYQMQAHHEEMLRNRVKYALGLSHHPDYVKYLQTPDTRSGFKKLFSSPEYEEKEQTTVEPSVYFSSLWTLQESCLCPHMTLMTRDWKPLLDFNGYPLTLERWQAVLTGLPVPADQIDQLLLEAPDFGWVVKFFNTIYSINASPRRPIDILVQANTRICSGRRAEAIMSAIGMTEWRQQPLSGTELVLGMFPIEMIREVALKSGSYFAVSLKDTGEPARAVDYFIGSTRGSFLPFQKLDKKAKRGKKGIRMSTFNEVNHQWLSTFASWTFLNNGSVTMKKAAILGEKIGGRARVFTPSIITINWNSTPGKWITRTGVSLQAWLNDQSDLYCTFAVNISQTMGVILQGFRSGSSAPRKLIKVGCYSISMIDGNEIYRAQQGNVEWLPVREVDWLVL